MAFFLKAVSGLYLILVWAGVALALGKPPAPLANTVGGGGLSTFFILLFAVSASIPAAIMFGFAQIVEDVRAIRKSAKTQTEHLTAMRRYYEPR